MNGEAYDRRATPQKYFTACLLAFYQQLWLWSTHRDKITDFNIEKPLWVFVGNTVSGEESDILEVVNFLAVTSSTRTRKSSPGWRLDCRQGPDCWMPRATTSSGALHAADGLHGNVEGLYADILLRVFNAPARQRLKLVNIKSSKGELALAGGRCRTLWPHQHWRRCRLLQTRRGRDAFDNEADDFGGALFGTLNHKDSKLNVLIGSRKFTEGWSSWRVSTMGLLNMGQGEGSQIIQFFGRGVRLKGKGYSLKRTTPQERPKGCSPGQAGNAEHLRRARQLYGCLQGLPEGRRHHAKRRNAGTGFPDPAQSPKQAKLKTLALKDGYKDNQKLGFKRKHFPWLYEVPEAFKGKIKKPHVVLDLYPRVEALSSQDKTTAATTEARHKGKLATKLFAHVRLRPHLPGLAELQAAAQLEQSAAGSAEAHRLLHGLGGLVHAVHTRSRAAHHPLCRREEAGGHSHPLADGLHRPFLQDAENGLRRPVLRRHPDRTKSMAPCSSSTNSRSRTTMTGWTIWRSWKC
jgi:hypothetical protein